MFEPAHPPTPLSASRSHPRGRSIYVTASNASTLAGEPEHGEAAAGGAGSGSASPRSARSPSSPTGRQLSPPWALPGHAGGQHGAPARPLQEHFDSLEQLGDGPGLPLSQLAPGAAGQLAAELAGLEISEEEALQRALELSLQEARQQPQQGQDGAAAPATAADQAASPAAAAAAAGAEAEAARMRLNPAFATSGREGRRNPLYAATSGAEAAAHRV